MFSKINPEAISLNRKTAGLRILRVAGVLFLLMLSAPVFAQTPENMRRDFEAVQKLNTHEAYEAFLKQYPDGLYASLAREELKKLALKEVRELIRAINFELARVGCAENAGGEEWTTESEEAVARFNQHAKTKLNPGEFGANLLNALREKTQRVCPLVCAPNERVQGDVCVAVAPPPSQTPPPAAKQAPAVKQPAQEQKKQASPKNTTWCLRAPNPWMVNPVCFSSEAQCMGAKDARATCVKVER